MSKSISQIQMDYRETLKQAEELEQISEELFRLVKGDLAETVQGIKQSWNGEAADRYCRKGQKLELTMKQHAQKIARTSELLKSIATVTYYAEMAGVAIGKNRIF